MKTGAGLKDKSEGWAFIYWGGIFKNKTDGELYYAVNDKSGKSAYVVSEMLEKNL